MGNYAIGIDLGTTYSCVAVVKDGNVKIIHNSCGSTTTASCVAFTDHERLIGDPAKSQRVRNFQNTVFDVKRLIGCRFEEEAVQKDVTHWPFRVVDVGGRCGVQVQFKKETKTFTPEELSAMVLTKMKKTAEAYLRDEVKDAVITVPAYFTDGQRQATKDAAEIAGLNVLRIINEPTAAGIAYATDEKTPRRQNILVYDLGGGTFDVTVMTVQKKNWLSFSGRHRSICVRSTSGDTHLGGEDLDTCLVGYCAEQFKKQHNIDITSNPHALGKLRKACEKAKRVLSSQTQTTLVVDSLVDGIDFNLDITRARFEQLCFHLFKKTLTFVEKALNGAKMSKDKIDEIVMVGGSTRIPKIQNLLMEYFDGKKLNNTVHPDEVVAYGAAIYAAILAGNKTDLVRKLKIQDVTPMSLGIETIYGRMSRVIEKNTPLPAKGMEVYVTTHDEQAFVEFPVYEGESDMTIGNYLLGEIELLDIREAPAGEVKFDVYFEIDENGILDVKATEKGTNNTGSIRIVRNTGSLSRERIAQLIKNEAKYVEEDVDRA